MIKVKFKQILWIFLVVIFVLSMNSFKNAIVDYRNNTNNINNDYYNNNNNNNNDDDNYDKNNNLDELFENVINVSKNVENTKNKSNNSIDFSNISSLLQNIDLSSIINIFSNKQNNNHTNENTTKNSIFNEIDPNTILKFQRIISSMNKSDPKKNLLLSLKPFLRKSRQDKVNEYITMLTIANVIGIFGSKGSDE